MQFRATAVEAALVPEMCFNSSVVQFRADKPTYKVVEKEFQFQCGAIQRANNMDVRNRGCEFQFQCGAIQRFISCEYADAHLCFNSSVVQFRAPRGPGAQTYDLFQFQCGAIQRSSTLNIGIFVFGFNSSVVQFRVPDDI